MEKRSTSDPERHGAGSNSFREFRSLAFPRFAHIQRQSMTRLATPLQKIQSLRDKFAKKGVLLSSAVAKLEKQIENERRDTASKIGIVANRWNALFDRVRLHGGIVHAKHNDLMQCECGNAMNMHDIVNDFGAGYSRAISSNVDWALAKSDSAHWSWPQWANTLKLPCPKCGKTAWKLLRDEL